jgi:hypothetical protein
VEIGGSRFEPRPLPQQQVSEILYQETSQVWWCIPIIAATQEGIFEVHSPRLSLAKSLIHHQKSKLKAKVLGCGSCDIVLARQTQSSEFKSPSTASKQANNHFKGQSGKGRE